jgi:hypothetical protein
MVFFKRGNDFLKPDGSQASDVEVLDFLASLEAKTEQPSAAEALTAGLATGVNEELEDAKEDLGFLIAATGMDNFSSALNAIGDLRKNLEKQDGYILDLITMSGADSQETAKVAIAKTFNEFETTKAELNQAKADIGVLEGFITELQEAAKVGTPADIKAVLEAKVAEATKAKGK